MVTMKKTILLLACFFFCAMFASAADRIDRALKDAVESFAPASGEKLVVGIGSLTYADKKIGSGFSRYLQEKLGLALTGSARLEYLDRDKLDDILKTAELCVSDVFDPKTAVQVNLKGIQALISGTFFDAGETVKVYLDLVDVGAGTFKGKVEVDLPKQDIPPTLSLLPDNYKEAISVVKEIGEVQESGSGSFTVKAWTPRGDGGTYKDGEKLVVNFRSSLDCYIRLFHVDVNKRMKLIFPNQYSSVNFIRANETYEIPDDSYPFSFNLGAPYGTEFIKVVASTVPFTDDEAAFRDLGAATRSIVTRGMGPKKAGARTAETILSYTIIK